MILIARKIVLSCGICLALAVPAARAQEVPPDEALEKLLEKLGTPQPDDPKPESGTKPTEAPKPESGTKPTAGDDPAQPESGTKPTAGDDPSKPESGTKPTAGDDPAQPESGTKPTAGDDPAQPESGTKPTAGDDPAPEVEDDALDKLLEGLGESEDRPETTGPPSGTGPGDPDGPDGAGPDGDPLEEDQKALDAELRRILGRVDKKPQQDQPEGGGALSEAIKKMEEVEKKLGEQDTGEQTRERQKEIIERIDTMIAQARQSGSGKGQGQRRMVQQDGPPDQPGQPGDQPGNTGAGVGPQQPQTPDLKDAVTLAKDTWGGLPPALREEMLNVFNEIGLPARKSLIDQYYLSITRKSIAEQGGNP